MRILLKIRKTAQFKHSEYYHQLDADVAGCGAELLLVHFLKSIIWIPFLTYGRS